MVKLTQIEDDSTARFNQNDKSAKPATKETYSDSEDSDSASDVDDDFDIENETVLDRIVALKDIISPQHRSQLVSFTERAKQSLFSGLDMSGKLLWTVTSSALLLSVPLSLAILSETQLQEMEKEMALQQSAQEVLAPGSEGAFNKNENQPATA